MANSTDGTFEANGTFEKDLADLADLYHGTLRGKADAIAAAWPPARDGDGAAVAALVALVHAVAGSAETFGYDDVSTFAGTAERLLRGSLGEDGRIAAGRVDAVSVVLTALQDAIDAGLRRRPAVGLTVKGGVPPQMATTVFLIDDDEPLARWLAEATEPFGYRLRCFPTPEAAVEAAGRERPEAVILDLGLYGAGPPGDAAAGFGPDVPVVFLTGRADFAGRLAAVRAGCAGYLVKPVDGLDLVHVLDELTGRREAEPYRVLIVDDDRAVPEIFALALRRAGMEATVLNRPEGILEAMAEVSPDLVLLDMYMPGCNGVEIAQVLRQHRRFLATPIVFLSREGDRDLQLVAMRPGVDDFLTKPIGAGHLVDAVLLRAERGRALRAAMQSDSLTGLLNHAHFKQRLAGELVRARRVGAPLSVALIDLDHFKQVNDRYGHLAGDRVIRTLSRLLSRRLRRTDVVGRYGGEEFAVLLPDTHEATAVMVLDDVREAFARIVFTEGEASFSVTLSGGVSAYGEASTATAASLLARADAALYAAKDAGRNRILRPPQPAA
ncbi:diguanylate cyclase [Azospirillum sp. ST 5-10]|uniref:diguanylate cyclase n=1 Tax=unclassified Azospirillum TaxID=2630922 RepID=UPI003F49D3A9